MRLLLRLYPRPWRERYGDELDELLEHEPMTATLMADLVRGAVVERFRAVSRSPVLATGGVSMSFDWPQRHAVPIALLALVITVPTLIVISLFAVAAVVGSAEFTAALNGALAGWTRVRVVDLFLIVAPAVAVVLSALSMMSGSAAVSDGALRLSLVARPRLLPVMVLLVSLALTAFWIGHLGIDFLAGRP
jgi:hypothetical protein